jgi:subfamily B ATP-binding cassette protein MsbA
MLQKPVRALTDVNEKIQRGIAASASVFDLLDMPAETDNGEREVERLRGEIRVPPRGICVSRGQTGIAGYQPDRDAGTNCAHWWAVRDQVRVRW